MDDKPCRHLTYLTANSGERLACRISEKLIPLICPYLEYNKHQWMCARYEPCEDDDA